MAPVYYPLSGNDYNTLSHNIGHAHAQYQYIQEFAKVMYCMLHANIAVCVRVSDPMDTIPGKAGGRGREGHFLRV